MIRDWKTLKTIPCREVSAPIGQPYYGNKHYMSAFCALESLAIMRMTDSELRACATQLTCGAVLAQEELARRETLE